jgi:pilus assembly protein CpaE
MLINFPHLLADVNVVLVVVEMTLASARDAIRILSWLKTNAAHVQPIVIANKVQSGVAEISKQDFEASIERKIGFTIPYDIKAATNAAKLGQTFADANRSTKAGSTIREIAKTIIGVGDGSNVDEVAKGKSSLLGKLDLKALMPKKGKAKDKQPVPAQA